MTEPDDRELEQYLKGDSPISRRYRDASQERAPPELDEAILARARAEARRKPNVNRYLAPVALAASLVLAVNLGWNLFEAEKARYEAPAPVASPTEQDSTAAPAPAAPPPAAPAEPQLRRKAAPPPETRAEAERDADAEQRTHAERKLQAQEQSGLQRREAYVTQDPAGAAAPSAAPRMALADTPALSEAAKIDHLVGYIGNLRGVAFIRNGKEYGPAEAAKHLQYKREKAGDRVRTAGDFIRLCASHSYLSGEAYLIRFEDGRTRTAEDLLREELSRIEAR